MGRHGHATDDYGTAARSNRLHRPAILANHAMHWVSSIIVLGISAYFLRNFTHNTHLRYWVSIVSLPSLRLHSLNILSQRSPFSSDSRETNIYWLPPTPFSTSQP
ncbi:hypothetical protein PMIN03_012558 [Paraphaeosphaeria minitans]